MVMSFCRTSNILLLWKNGNCKSLYKGEYDDVISVYPEISIKLINEYFVKFGPIYTNLRRGVEY